MRYLGSALSTFSDLLKISKMTYLYISFYSSKSYCMVFKLKWYKLSCPRLLMDNQLLKYTDDIKYLGFTFSSDQKDDKDLFRELNCYTQN